MNLTDLLNKNRKSIVNNWFEAVIDSYPSESGKFLKNNRDKFANPVGHTTSECLKEIFNSLLKNSLDEDFKKILDPIIRIRAVQDFTPEQAVGFFFSLKTIIRREFKKDILKADLMEEYLEFETRIDKAACIGFNIYMECRGQVASLQVKRQRNQVRNALREKGLIKDNPEDS